MAKRGKKYSEALKLVDRQTRYALPEAVELVKKTSYAKFDATVEVAFRLNLDPRKAEQNLRGAVSLPHGTGKEVRVLVITRGEKAKLALEAGADYAGDVEYLDKIKNAGSAMTTCALCFHVFLRNSFITTFLLIWGILRTPAPLYLTDFVDKYTTFFTILQYLEPSLSSFCTLFTYLSSFF